MIYLDNCATTKAYEEAALKAFEIMTKRYANPSSPHSFGFELKKELDRAAERTAAFINAERSSIIFTSGATESNNIIVNSLRNARKKHIISTKAEHASMYKPLEDLKKEGYKIDFLDMEAESQDLDIKKLIGLINDDTLAVSIMHVNNETGKIFDIENIFNEVKKINSDIICISDAVQSFGKIKTDMKKIKADFISASAHKVHAPKGVGVLYARDLNKVKPLLLGGGQQRKIRSGTENLPGIAALSETLHIRQNNIDRLYGYVLQLKEFAISELENIDDVRINCKNNSSPYVLSIAALGIKGEVLVHMLEKEGIFVSTSSACSSSAKADGRVLEAFKIPKDYADGTIRVSFSEFNTLEEIETFCDVYKKSIKYLRSVTR